MLLYNFFYSDDDDYVPEDIPDIIEEFDNNDGGILSSSSDESRSSSRLSDHPGLSNEKDYKLKPCQITITAQDRAKAEKALELQELLKQMKSCSVVIIKIKDSKVIPRRSVSTESFESSSSATPMLELLPSTTSSSSPSRTDSRNSQILLPPAFKPKKSTPITTNDIISPAEIKAEKYLEDRSEKNEEENNVESNAVEEEEDFVQNESSAEIADDLKKEKFKCEICEKICKNESAKEQHMKFTHTNNPPPPKQEENNDSKNTPRISGPDNIQNPDIRTDDDEYSGLVERENGKGAFCNLCQKSFAKLRAGKAHYTKFHSVPKYKCTLCSNTKSTRTNAERHVRTVHKIQNPDAISNSIQHVSVSDRSRNVSAASSINSGISEASSSVGGAQKRRRSDSAENPSAGPSSKKLKIEKENSTETKPSKVANKPGPKSQKTASALAQSNISSTNIGKDISDNNPGDNSKSVTPPPPPPPSILTPNLPQTSRETTSNNDSLNDEYFCLDCENCNNSKCKHTSHPRRHIQNKTAHIQEYAHGRFQKCSDFMMINKVKVKIPDSAYDSKDGPKIRKLYKKYAEVNKDTSPVNLFEYESGEKVCKIPKCIYRNNSIVYMFRHIREDHFQDH